MEKINLEREKSGLQPQPIDELETWLDKQPLTPEETKMFMALKAQTPKEERRVSAQSILDSHRGVYYFRVIGVFYFD